MNACLFLSASARRIVGLSMKLCHAQSVINRELTERQNLLKDALIPAPSEGIPVSGAMTGRMVPLLPGLNMMSGVPGSKLSDKLEDIQEKFEESIRVGVSPCAALVRNSRQQESVESLSMAWPQSAQISYSVLILGCLAINMWLEI